MSRFTGKLGELHSAYQRVISSWPADKLRPTHCYKSILKTQMNAKFDRIGALRGDDLSRQIVLVEKEIAALNSLLSNKYRSQYRLSDGINDPVSHKGYYVKLLNSIDEAVKSNKKTALRVD
ncbi:hypothetical protein LPJ73_005827 [Coemansia sp. RSA 2703]|nr:hypothetical protein LPJ73_005827 [Coemansia sp. RSA 2703]